MFEIFLYLLAIVFVFWLTSEPKKESHSTVITDGRLNSNEESGRAASEVEILNNVPPSIAPNPYSRKIPSSPSLYPWVAAKKVAEEDFCRLNHNQLCATRSYAY